MGIVLKQEERRIGNMALRAFVNSVAKEGFLRTVWATEPAAALIAKDTNTTALQESNVKALMAKPEVLDQVTHTGQVWSDDDIRQTRFACRGTTKYVNPNFSLDLIEKVPPVEVQGNIAVCDGGPSEALGHPKIYINLDQPGNHSCIYCGLKFYKKAAAH